MPNSGVELGQRIAAAVAFVAPLVLAGCFGDRQGVEDGAGDLGPEPEPEPAGPDGPPEPPDPMLGSTSVAVGQLVRVQGGAKMYREPDPATLVARLPGDVLALPDDQLEAAGQQVAGWRQHGVAFGVPMEVLAINGDWLRVRTPDPVNRAAECRQLPGDLEPHRIEVWVQRSSLVPVLGRAVRLEGDGIATIDLHAGIAVGPPRDRLRIADVGAAVLVEVDPADVGLAWDPLTRFEPPVGGKSGGGVGVGERLGRAWPEAPFVVTAVALEGSDVQRVFEARCARVEALPGIHLTMTGRREEGATPEAEAEAESESESEVESEPRQGIVAPRVVGVGGTPAPPLHPYDGWTPPMRSTEECLVLPEHRVLPRGTQLLWRYTESRAGETAAEVAIVAPTEMDRICFRLPALFEGPEVCALTTALEARPTVPCPAVGAGAVQPAKKPKLMGPRKASRLMKVVRGQMRDAQHCWAWASAASSVPLEGSFSLNFLINQDGSVPASVVQMATVGLRPLGACLAQASKQWTFPPIDDRTRTIVTLTFEVTGAELPEDVRASVAAGLALPGPRTL